MSLRLDDEKDLVAGTIASGFRLLKFPDALEAAYRTDNARRGAEVIRRIMPWVTPLWVAAAGALLLSFGDTATPWVTNSLLPVGVAIGWLWAMIASRQLEKAVHLHVGLALLVAQFANLRTVFLLGEHPFSLFVILQAIYLLLILFTLPRMRLLPAAACAVLPAVLALVSAVIEGYTVDWLSFAQFYGNTVMLGIVIGYVLEHRDRLAWLQTRQLDIGMRDLEALRLQSEAESRLQRLTGEYLEQVAGNLTATEIAGRSLRFLVERTAVQVGTIYLVEGNRLRRAASCGLEGETRTADELGRGETLVGQAAEDGRRLRLTHLPADYHAIRTATGSAPPAELLVEPVRHQDTTLAVIELGALAPLQEADLVLVGHIGRAMATALVAAHARDALARAGMADFAI